MHACLMCNVSWSVIFLRTYVLFNASYTLDHLTKAIHELVTHFPIILLLMNTSCALTSDVNIYK